MPAAQAQIEPETEGTEEIDGSGEHDAEYEYGPEDSEPEREEPDVLALPPDGEESDPLELPDDDTGEGAPGDTAPGVLNAPPPSAPSPPPPATAPLRAPAPDAPANPAPERRLGQQPQPPDLRPRAPRTRERHTRTREPQSGIDDGGRQRSARAPSSTNAPLQPLPPAAGSSSPYDPRDTLRQPTPDVRGLGDSSRVPVGAYHVRPGDSLWSIAEAQLGPAARVAEVARAVDRLWRLNSVRIGTGDSDLVMPSTVLRLR